MGLFDTETGEFFVYNGMNEKMRKNYFKQMGWRDKDGKINGKWYVQNLGVDKESSENLKK